MKDVFAPEITPWINEDSFVEPAALKKAILLDQIRENMAKLHEYANKIKARSK